MPADLRPLLPEIMFFFQDAYQLESAKLPMHHLNHVLFVSVPI